MIQEQSPSEQYVFGGVDSRSNPLNMPQDRSLRCFNWVPNPGGWLEFRRGYTPTSSGGTTGLIHSIAPYEMWNGTRYLLFGEGATVYTLALATGIVTTVGTLDTPNPWDWFPANGQIHLGDGIAVWFFDGFTLRRSGIRALTATEVKNITVSATDKAPSPTPTDANAVTVGNAATGGAINATTGTGIQMYMFYYDKVRQIFSGALPIGNRQQLSGVGTNKIALTTLPNLSGISANLVKVFAFTPDGSTYAQIVSHGPLGNGAATIVGSTVTITGAQSSPPSVGDIIFFNDAAFLGDLHATGLYVVTATGGSGASFHFSFVLPAAVVSSFVTVSGGIAWGKIANAANAAAALDIVDDPSLSVPFMGDVSTWQGGLPASAVGGAQPGYQFFACIWDPTTQHVGNRMAIGKRLTPIVQSLVSIGGLPDLSGENSEWNILIGYSIDGGQIPYLILDSGGNWLSVKSGVTEASIGANYALDFTSEMPYRNGVPLGMNKFCVIGDQALGCTGLDAYVYVSASAADPVNPEVVGQPAQSWAPSDVVTFPTREVPTCIAEYNQSAIVFSRNYSAPLVNMQGVWDWGQGFPVGAAGQRAFTKTTHGPFWVTGQKQLATINTNWGSGYALATGPILVSDEYERGLLARIGDQYLSEVQVVAYIDAAKMKDELVIKCRDASGVPFEIVHDFKLKDERSPFGQAYMRQYKSVLAANYTLANGIDSNGVERMYAGGPDGNLYLMESGWNDNGVEYATDFIGLVPLGPNKPSISDVQLWGDRKIIDQQPLSINRRMDGTGDWEQMTPVQDRGETHNFQFHNRFKDGELQFCYVRLQMQSHSADAPATEMSDPPHCPLEDYGKIYMARILTGTERGD